MKKTLLFVIIILLISSSATLPKSKTDFIQQLSQWRIPENLPHPRLYFGSKGAGQLQQRYQSTEPRIIEFLSDCDSLLRRPVPDYSDYNESRYVARAESEKLAFAFAITQDKKYADYAKKIVKQMTQWPDWVYAEHKPRIVDLGVAGVAYILALCYDWLYPVLTSAERENIEKAIVAKALAPFHRVYASKSEGWTHAEHNWRSVICGEMGVVTLALLDKAPNIKENLQFAIDGVVDVLDHGGIDGGWNEGVSYWGYGIGQAIMFVEALQNVSSGAVDLYALPFLKATGNFGLYTRTPAGSCFNFSDCNVGPPRPWLMAILASHYQNPYWQWSALKDIGNSIADILFYNPNLQAQKPEALPLGKYFRGIQVATMRSSWDKDAVFVGLKSGQSTANHSHLDLNSFILHAHGKPLLVDQPNWPYAHYLGFFDFKNQRWDFEGNHTIAHNTLLVDGQGQGYGATFQGRIVNFKSTPEFQFAVGEADSAYGDLLNKFRRYVALVEDKFIVIVDDVESEALRQLQWLMHYQGEVTEYSSGVFHIVNDQAQLDVQFLRPAKADNRVVSFERHESTYKATREATTQINKFVAIRPLHRQKQYRFIVTAFPHLVSNAPSYSTKIVAESENNLIVELKINDKSYKLNFDFQTFIITPKFLK